MVPRYWNKKTQGKYLLLTFLPSEQLTVHCLPLQEELVEPEHENLTEVVMVTRRERRMMVMMDDVIEDTD